MQVKTCSKCLRPEGEVAFAIEKTRNGGLRARGDCKDCRKAYLRDFYAKNPDYFTTYRESHRAECNARSVASARRARHERYNAMTQLKSRPCMDCGKYYPSCAMDFDHRDPSTKIVEVSSLAKSAGTPWTKVLEEIAKCDLVCRNCHALRTYKGIKGYRGPGFLAVKARIDGIKSSTPCLDCHKSFVPCQMEFDHVRGVKSKNVSQLVGRPWAEIEAEMAKCDLVCANCHRVRTQQRHPGRAPNAGKRIRKTTSSQEIQTA